ncbi:MAG TPA: RluA family pseudouridine synthase [Candidatus Megaira endosymbiont of Hartmannula sinica]|nr:RluA family pseudouridine synthase [Candidatus Megaera endosymbiont of Hartmannula sinica]
MFLTNKYNVIFNMSLINNSKSYSFNVDREKDGVRIDKFLIEAMHNLNSNINSEDKISVKFSNITRADIKNHILNDSVKVKRGISLGKNYSEKDSTNDNKKDILVTKASFILKVGDIVCINLIDQRKEIDDLNLIDDKKIETLEKRDRRYITELDSSLVDPDIDNIKIKYQDEDILIISKPQNLTVHEGSSLSKEINLVNILIANNIPLSTICFDRQGIVHRLDKDTGGLMILAKNNKVHTALQEMIKNKKIERKYLALLYGRILPMQGTIYTGITRSSKNYAKMICLDSKYINYINGKDNNKQLVSRNNIQITKSLSKARIRDALSEYKTLELLKYNLSLVEFTLHTGRTHQIRAQCHYINNNIVGDKLYFNNKNDLKYAKQLSEQEKIKIYDIKESIKNLNRQALHSYYLSFYHPLNGELIEIKDEIPQDINSIINSLKE